MAPVYFDTSVFLAVMAGEATAGEVRSLLHELRNDKVRIYTSILTVQEAAVSSFLHGAMFNDPHTKIAKMARVASVTRDIAMTAAKFEALVIMADRNATASAASDNKRRKFDLFHLATALAFGCSRLYTFDRKFKARAKQLNMGLEVLAPAPKSPMLPLEPSGFAPAPPGG